MFNIIDQTKACNDQAAFTGKQPEYAGLLNDNSLEFLLVKITSAKITFVNLLTGNGESYSGACRQNAYKQYVLKIIDRAGWVEKTWGTPGYFFYIRKEQPSA